MSVLTVKNLCKTYPKFKLDNVSFELEKGKIYGFIGRNGAGKTTTLKSLLNFVHPDSGEIRFFDKPFEQNELEIKQKIGFVSGAANYYINKKLHVVTDVTKRFYDNWDDEVYYRYCEMFALDADKTPSQLSAGMKVKYSLALAMSHHAELLILDEPTSGLDPVSRDDLLDVFLDLVKNEGVTLLFSTHITTDLDRCADEIIYIKNGHIIAQSTLDSYIESYRLMRFIDVSYTPIGALGVRRERNGFTALIPTSATSGREMEYDKVNLEDIMLHIEKED